jgi:PAS domain S-box-containing protein
MNPLVNRKPKSHKAFFDVISKIASLFALMQIENSNDAITQSLKLIGDHVKADRAYIFRYDFIESTTSNTHEYCAQGITKEIHNLQHIPLGEISYWVETHLNHEPLYIYDVLKLSTDDHVRQILEPQGVKSLLTIPLIRKGEVYGFLGLDSVKQKHKYSKFELDVLNEYSSLLINVIERLELDQALRNEKMKSELIAQSAYIGTWDWNLVTDQILVNEIWADMIGYTLDELEPTTIETWKKLTHPDDLDQSIRHIQDVIERKTSVYSYEIRMKHKKGHYVWIRDIGRIIEWNENQPIRMVGAHIDINILKENEQKLKVITQAIEYSPVSIVITDNKSIIQYASPKFEKMTGFLMDEIIGKRSNILKSGHHNSEFYREIYEQMNQNKVWTGEFYNRKKDGTFYWDSSAISAVFDEKNQLTHYIAIKRDISEKVAFDELLAKRRNELENEVDLKMSEIEDSQRSTIIALAKLTEARDGDTGQHVERVQYLSKALSSSMGNIDQFKKIIDKDFVKDIFYASALHDIGKINIPDHILLKPGKLNDDEFDIIKSHVSIGDKILSDMIKFYPKSNIVLMGRKIAKFHHEKWDGSGYLGKTNGEDIPLAARIVSLVDAYDAIRSKRPYKEEKSHQQAYEIIVADSGKHFDPNVVKAFIDINEQFDAIYNSLK